MTGCRSLRNKEGLYSAVRRSVSPGTAKLGFRATDPRTPNPRTLEARILEARTLEARTLEARTLEARTREPDLGPQPAETGTPTSDPSTWTLEAYEGLQPQGAGSPARGGWSHDQGSMRRGR